MPQSDSHAVGVEPPVDQQFERKLHPHHHVAATKSKEVDKNAGGVPSFSVSKIPP